MPPPPSRFLLTGACHVFVPAEAIAEAEAHVAPASLAASRAQRARFAQLYPSYLRIDRLLTEAREALETQCAELDQARTRAEGADAAARGEGEEGEEEALTHMRLLRRERALRQALEGAFEAKKGVRRAPAIHRAALAY